MVNIVLNGLPKTWDAFSASMNIRKKYPTFEEFQEQKEAWFKEEVKSREIHFRSTVLQLSKVWPLQESLSRAKEKEGET